MRVTFIHHSSFMVELDNVILLFDYFDPCDYGDASFKGILPIIDLNKELYVFASHAHKDHFDVAVIRKTIAHPKVHYIFSNDIKLSNKYLAANDIDAADFKSKLTKVHMRQNLVVDSIRIETFKSTDAGVAFYVEADGKSIFHAGDLHWWNIGQRGELYSEKYGLDFKREIKLMRDKSLDLAFVVLDPRMETGATFGIEFFLETVPVEYVFPMHMWQQYDIQKELKKRPVIAHHKDKLVEIDQENLVFDFED